MKKDPEELQKLLNVCTLCGSCNHRCPIFGVELTEPNSPRGKINLIKEFLAGNISDSEEMKELISVCLICGYCQHSCSKGVDFRSIFTGYLSLTGHLDDDNYFD